MFHFAFAMEGMMYKRSLIYLGVFLLLASVGSGEFVSSVNGEELIAGGDFEDAVQSEIPGWNDFWARSGEGNATVVTVNFGANDYRIPGRTPIPAMSHRVEGLPSSNQ
jgi:hypothetical protein